VCGEWWPYDSLYAGAVLMCDREYNSTARPSAADRLSGYIASACGPAAGVACFGVDTHVVCGFVVHSPSNPR
jgi:hypothetical protein